MLKLFTKIDLIFIYSIENIYTTNDFVFLPLKLSILQEKKTLYNPIYKVDEDVIAKIKPPVDEGQEITMEYVESVFKEKHFDHISE